jgi:predicted lipid-binding transport protein (Tim44 family)
MPQESDRVALLVLLWIARICWALLARSSTSKATEGGIEGEQENVQLSFAEADPVSGVREFKKGHKPLDREISIALDKIALRDRSFSIEGFLSGAAAAYEEIAMAFASGDRRTLEALTSREVFDDLCAEIADRERRGEQIDTRFVRIGEPELTDVHLSEEHAELSVRFCSELFSVTRSESGAIIRGSPHACTTIVDMWTFAKPFSSQLPRWKLVVSNAA